MSDAWQQQKVDYDRDGYIVVRRFLAGDQLAELQSELDRYIHEVVPTLATGDVFYTDPARPETLKQMHRLELDPYFEQFQTSAHWCGLAESLLGENVQVHGVEWFNKPPGGSSPTPPHQDNYYFCLTPPKVLTMWLALDEIDEENGCLRYLPGSHREGIRRHSLTQTSGFSQGIADYGDEELSREVAILAQPGDLLIHHGNTIHRADPNQSATRHRRTFAMVVQGVSCRRDESAFDRYANEKKQQQHELGLT